MSFPTPEGSWGLPALLSGPSPLSVTEPQPEAGCPYAERSPLSTARPLLTAPSSQTLLSVRPCVLQASSGVKQWNKRWFVLVDRCLFYYKGEPVPGAGRGCRELVPPLYYSALSRGS